MIAGWCARRRLRSSTRSSSRSSSSVSPAAPRLHAAAAVAAAFGLELCDASLHDPPPAGSGEVAADGSGVSMVVTADGRLALQLSQPPPPRQAQSSHRLRAASLCLDFSSRALYDRATDMVRARAALLRAAGCDAPPAPAVPPRVVLDATAGTGRDAFTLAASRAAPHVLLLERDARVAALLADALLRARAAATTAGGTCPPAWLAHVAAVCASRMTLVHGDACALLARTGRDACVVALRPGDDAPCRVPAHTVLPPAGHLDALYMDPMWSHTPLDGARGARAAVRPSGATPRNDLAILGRLLPPQPAAYPAALLAAAAAASPRRLVVKRHAAAPPLSHDGRAPTTLSDGDGAAFDVWRAAGSPS